MNDFPKVCNTCRDYYTPRRFLACRLPENGIGESHGMTWRLCATCSSTLAVDTRSLNHEAEKELIDATHAKPQTLHRQGEGRGAHALGGPAAQHAGGQVHDGPARVGEATGVRRAEEARARRSEGSLLPARGRLAGGGGGARAPGNGPRSSLRKTSSGPAYRPATPASVSPPPRSGVVVSPLGIREYRPFVALTIWQPWAWAITAGLKLVENRTWRPPGRHGQPGDVIAIHAAKRQADWEDVAAVRQLAVQAGRGLEVPREFVHSAITALAVVDRFVTSPDELPREQRGWWVGPVGWVLRDVRPLPTPIACGGQQGLWPCSGEVVHEAWDQLEPRQAEAADHGS